MTELPDEAIEAFFVGDANEAWEQDEALMRLLDDVLIGATGPAPRPGPALLAFLEEPSAGATTPRTATPPPPAAPPWQARTIAAGATPTDRGQNVVPLFRRLRLTVGIAAAGGVAAAGLAVVGTTAGVLPKPVMQVVSWAVGAVTPFELHEPAKTLSGGDHVPQQGPTSTGRPGPLGPVVGSGPLGPVVGPGPAGQSGAPGRPAVSTPATPPASIAAGVPGAVRPPGTSVDPGPPTSAGPPAPPVPAPPVPASAVSPPAGGGTPSTTPPTWVDRARQAPVDGTVPSTVAGPSARRP